MDSAKTTVLRRTYSETDHSSEETVNQIQESHEAFPTIKFKRCASDPR